MMTMAHMALALLAGFSVAGMVWYGWGAIENLAHRFARPKAAAPAPKAKESTDEK
ncbi:MAG: hypothetical protein AMXMBFR84_39700 [Candidatus Hydrogenedentota bacterium]